MWLSSCAHGFWFCAGCQPRFAEAGLDGLVQFEDTTNFTLANSSIVGINAAKSSNILNFVNTSRITVTDFSSRECNVSGFVLAFDNYNAYEADSLVTVEASQFSDSAAGSIGIFNHSASIRDSTFNSISVYGHLSSTIWHVNQDDSRLEVSNCSFTNLVNNNGVPAIHVARADMYISTSSFINCTAGFAVVHIDNDPLLNGSYNSNETVTVESSVFANCNASNGNSVLYHLGKDLTPHQQLNVYNSVFRNNIAAIGGAVTVLAVGFAEVVGCTFEENASLGGLGALYAYGWPEQASAISPCYSFLSPFGSTCLQTPCTPPLPPAPAPLLFAMPPASYLTPCSCSAV